MTNTLEAWLLDGGTQPVALAPPELAAVVYQPRIHPLPLAPEGLPGFALWQGVVIPVMDLAWRAGGVAAGGEEKRPFLGVARFADPNTGQVAFGGLLLNRPPVVIPVDDRLRCPYPEPIAFWREVSWSCFLHQGIPTPILKLSALFGGE